MGFLDRLFGADQTDTRQRSARSEDEIALERYRYLLRTAPPEQIEQAHAEAFSKLTPQQRQLLFDELQTTTGADAPRSSDAQALAASATRSELRNPGTMERTMQAPAFQGAGGAAMGFGSMFASSLLGSVAGYVIGSAIMGAFLPDASAFDGSTDASADSSADSADASSFDDGGGDFGGFGDFDF